MNPNPKREETQDKLGSMPVGRLLVSMSVPMMGMSSSILETIFSLKNARCFSEQTMFSSISVLSVISSAAVVAFLFVTVGCIFPVSRKFAIHSVSSPFLPDAGRLFSLRSCTSSSLR